MYVSIETKGNASILEGRLVCSTKLTIEEMFEAKMELKNIPEKYKAGLYTMEYLKRKHFENECLCLQMARLKVGESFTYDTMIFVRATESIIINFLSEKAKEEFLKDMKF